MMSSMPCRSKSALLAVLLALLTACSRHTPEEQIATAERYLAEGNPRAAEIELRNAIQQAPGNGKAHRLLGTTLARFGDPVTAEAVLRKSLTLSEKSDDVLPKLAVAMLRQGQPQRIIAELGGANLQDPTANASLRATVGQALLMRGQVKEAAEAFAASLA
ncbi:MAG TPA: tetratricopeptide repeat protein, partial [Burkholderiaceae bacterium]|nr:tetratricopeptide repeat protein [Burkholderiaceae bacterium]